MQQQIKQALEQIGETASIISIQAVSGGDINRAYHVETGKQHYFIKLNNNVPAHFFQFEATGLQQIEQTNTIAVPQVYYYNRPKQSEQAIMIMDWIQGSPNQNTVSVLGQHIARLHQHSHTHFGFDQHGFIGTLDQHNQYTANWVHYFREFRLRPLIEKAHQHHRLPKERKSKLEALINRLEELLPTSPRASLLHGDLWGGNWMVGPNGMPYVIDPAVFYGDHLFELAFTEVFGGFDPTFYHAYQEVFPIEPYYQEVKPIYQLYYLLVHLILFGEGYGASVDRIIAYYTS